MLRIVPILSSCRRLTLYYRTYVSLADQAREITKSHNRVEAINDLKPVIDQILSTPQSGKKKKFVNIHPTKKQDLKPNDYQCPEEDKPHTFFMDLLSDHIEYLESEGFKINDGFDPASDDSPEKRKRNPKFPHKSINW